MASKPLPPPRSKYHAERIREVFNQIDVSGDGSLSFLEIKKGLSENEDIDWVRLTFERPFRAPPLRRRGPVRVLRRSYIPLSSRGRAPPEKSLSASLLVPASPPSLRGTVLKLPE